MASVEIRHLLGKLNGPCVAALQAAAASCRQATHYEVTVEHLLWHLQGDPSGDVAAIYRHFEVAGDRVQKALVRVLQGLRTGNGGMPVFSPLLVKWLEDAFLLSAVDYGLPKIRSGVLLLTLVAQPGRSSVTDFTDELEKVRADELKRELLSIVAGSDEDQTQPETAGASPAPGTGITAGTKGAEEALGRFTVDLTAKAREGMDPVLGRDHEIRQMIDVLTRRRKNNPVVVGEAGVGKTAVVEGFAQRVAAGDVPVSLKGVRILTLDLGLLQAGAGVKGEFENRLKGVIQEVQAATTPTILFIDEIHTLIGAGGSAGTGDAANLLKPPLARGELRTIGATTLSEYKKYIEKDAALERRFQPIHVEEPSAAVTVTMLRGVKEKFEQHHGVRVLDRAIEAASQLADRYISGRQLPDKAVDVLDTACARVAIGQSAKPGALDDLERKIAHLDTAIAAIEEDAEHAPEDRSEELAKLRVQRADTDTSRGELHGRWSRELEAVSRIRELQKQLAEAKKRAAEPAAEAADPPSGDAEPLLDPAALREQIDKAARELEAMQGEKPLVQLHVDAPIIGQVVSDWTGIPAGKMMRDELAQVLALEDRLRERVVGQDSAIEAIARKIRASKAGLQAPTQPIGVFLLVGPSGVGKTEISTALADLLFGGERFMVTVNMTEFMEKHSISKLIGSPPGYVGYGEGGVLTEAVRHRPYSVVLLDEIEKADPEVMNLFYQVFDKGTLADGEGRVVDFKNTIVMMGSNLASDVIMKACEADEPPSSAQLVDMIRPTLQKWLKPALLGRMTIVPFFPLGPEVMRLIAEMKLRRVGRRLEDSHGIAFEVRPEARDALAQRCTDSESGARNVDHVIDQTILPRISLQLLERMAAGDMPKRVVLGVSDEGDFRFDFTGDEPD